MIAEIC